MSLHDTYARRTPFELAFREKSRAEALMEAVAEEAEGRGADPEEPHAFVTMGAVAAFVHELEGPDAPAGAIHQYGALAYHGLHFARAGYPLYLLNTHAARYLVGGVPEGEPVPPTGAGYLQLPQHLFWTTGVDGTPESVDGIFWTLTRRDMLHTLMAIGIRPDRPGLGVVPLPEAPIADTGAWLTVDARGDGRDFANDLPGGDFDALYGVETAGEVLKLLARCFAYLSAVPAASVAGDAGPSPNATQSVDGAPPPSMLSFTSVTLAS